MTRNCGPEDLLPQVSSDEDEVGWGDRPGEAEDDDERLRREGPPHHGG